MVTIAIVGGADAEVAAVKVTPQLAGVGAAVNLKVVEAAEGVMVKVPEETLTAEFIPLPSG